MFGWHTVTWADLQSRTGTSPVYLYYFDQRPPYPEGSRLAGAKGAPHAAELPFVFGHLGQRQGLEWSDADRGLADAIQAYWTNFAKNLDPNGEGLPEWPRYTEAMPQAMIFHDTPAAGALPDPQQFAVLERYFAWRRSPEGEQP